MADTSASPEHESQMSKVDNVVDSVEQQNGHISDDQEDKVDGASQDAEPLDDNVDDLFGDEDEDAVE